MQLAMAAAVTADRITLPAFGKGNLTVDVKPDLSPVSEADRAVEVAIRQLIAQQRPADAVLGEEMGTTGGGARRWVIDPIDGTVNFVRGIPVWATLIALEVDGEIEIGVASAPALGRRWWAVRGEGAFAGGPGTAGKRVHVSGVTELAEAAISSGCIGHYRDPRPLVELAGKTKHDRGFGDFWQHVLVAEGSIDVALEPVGSIWDFAALQVIVEEAGGRFTDFAGARRLDGGNAVSSNGLVHDEVVALVSGSGQPLP